MRKLLHAEILQELEAIKNFTEMAIECQKSGCLKGAEFFLGQAIEDVHHTFKYAREIDKYEGKEDADLESVLKMIQKYEQMEFKAVERVLAIKEEAKKENNLALIPFLNSILNDHSEEAYVAKKLVQQAKVFVRTEDLASLEDAFEQLEEE